VTASKDLELSPVELELRQPPAALVLYAASFVVAAGMVVFFVTQQFVQANAFSLVFPVVLTGIVVYNVATVRSRAWAHADGRLVVRNRFSTRTLQRTDVDRVLVGGQASLDNPRRVELLLTDGEVLPLVGTEAPPLPGVRARLERDAEQLRAWVTGTPTPYR
jgi:hypothetical protein